MKKAGKVMVYPSVGDHIYVVRSLGYAHHGRLFLYYVSALLNQRLISTFVIQNIKRFSRCWQKINNKNTEVPIKGIGWGTKK